MGFTPDSSPGVVSIGGRCALCDCTGTRRWARSYRHGTSRTSTPKGLGVGWPLAAQGAAVKAAFASDALTKVL
jgi:hypothetical protein